MISPTNSFEPLRDSSTIRLFPHPNVSTTGPADSDMRDSSNPNHEYQTFKPHIVILAQEIMQTLAPIFESIRRQREMPYSYPITVGGRRSIATIPYSSVMAKFSNL